MYSYYTYGLGIQSEIPLPELLPAQGDGDVYVRLRNAEPTSHYNKFNETNLEMNKVESVLSIENVGIFRICNGKEIIIITAPEADIRRIRRFIIGTALAILLYQRGSLVLHACTVNIDDHAVAFLGFSGSGKSSIAAALHTRGYGVLTDDVTVVEMIDDQPVVLPGFPQLKLDLESSKAIGCDVDELQLIDGINEKYGYRLDHGFTDTPLRLERIYVLGENPRSGIELLSPQNAAIRIISLSVPTIWTQLRDPNHFKQCINLANLVPVYLLKRNSKIQSLPTSADYVEKHIWNELQ